jgi:hypothetical protein
MFFRHINRGRCWARFSGQRKSIQSVRTCTEFEGHTVTNSGHIFQGIWHVFQSIVLLSISVQLQQKFGMQIEDSPYSILCWDNRTVVWISDSEIEEQSPRLYR